MSASLILNANTALNQLSLNLSNYLDLTEDTDLDPQNPAFSNKVISHSLLKEGGVLALEDLQAKELVFPLKLNAPAGAVTNLVTDPSFEYDAPGDTTPGNYITSGAGSFLSAGGSLLVVNTQSFSGDQSCQVTTTSGNTNEGLSAIISAPAGGFLSTQTYTCQVALKGNAGSEPVQLVLGVSGDNTPGTHVVLTTSWQVFTVQWTPGSTETTAQFAVRTTSATATVFFVDAACVTVGAGVPALPKGIPPNYVDGDQLGCQWNGPAGMSTSTYLGGSSALARMVQQIQQVCTTPSASYSWQDDGMGQPTTFDGISGEFDVKYSYRQSSSPGHWLLGDLKLFTEPLGRMTGVRPYAAASGVGPLLMISPFASGGQNILTASAVGYGASPGSGPMGASSGISYFGNPNLSGDATSQLQISYVGPLPNGASNTGTVPYVAVSLLPDQNYQPLITAKDMSLTPAATASQLVSSTAVASTYWTIGASHSSGFGNTQLQFAPLAAASAGGAGGPPVSWSGLQRMFAIARASGAPGYVASLANSLIPTTTIATVMAGDWGVYDIGTFVMHASEGPQQQVQIALANSTGLGGASTSAIDLTAIVTLPDSSTWFLSPKAIQGSQYGYPTLLAESGFGLTIAPYTNTILIDDVVGDQFLYGTASQTSAPSPIGAISNSSTITPYTRGLVPRPDPKNGPPIIAIFSVGQNSVPSTTIGIAPGFFGAVTSPGASWANPQNQHTMAQVNVLERTRYVLG